MFEGHVIERSCGFKSHSEQKGENMKKVFMNRTVMPEDTAARAIQYVDEILKIDYDFEIVGTPDKLFWTSIMQVKDLNPADITYSTSAGKGITKEECLSSNYGEFLEKLSWEVWKLENFKKDSIPIKNLITGEKQLINSSMLKNQFETPAGVAAGNNIEEARFHALMDIVETGGHISNNPYTFFPLETNIVDSKEVLDLMDNYHNNLQILVQKDPRLPHIYHITAFRAPGKDDELMLSPVEVKNNEVKFNFDKMPRGWSPIIDNSRIGRPWPPLVGRRFGLSLDRTVPKAIGEILQIQQFYNQAYNTNIFVFDNNGTEKIYQDYWPKKKAEDFPNFETPTVEGDLEIVISDFKNAGYSLWEIDLTLPESPISAVKIISDYTYGRWTPGSREVLSRLFKI